VQFAFTEYSIVDVSISKFIWSEHWYLWWM